MTVGLEKLVQDIKNETSIWPVEKSKNTPEEDAAWDRVGARNKMSGNHVKSIFKVLSKKYETEKLKPNTNWKLFEYLKFLDEKIEPEVVEEEDDVPDDADLEDDGEFVELLEVNEYEESEDEDNGSGASGSGQSSRNVSMEDDHQKQQTSNNKILNSKTEANTSQKSQIMQAIRNSPQPQQQQKLSPQQQIKQLKGIEVKKVINSQQQQTKILLKNSNEQQQQNKKIINNEQLSSVEMKLKQNYEAARNQTQYNNNNNKQRGSILSSESLKRKLPQQQSEQIKKTIISSDNNGHKENIVGMSPPPAKKLAKEFVTTPSQGRNNNIGQKQNTELLSGQITTIDRNIKSSSPAELMNEIIKSSSSQQQQQNGFKIDIKQELTEIIENVEQDTTKEQQQQKQQNSNLSLNNENNIETILPTFFRDLYNTKKYDCFGMYVASAMNRLPKHLASKLETKILKAIIEVNSLVSNDGDD